MRSKILLMILVVGAMLACNKEKAPVNPCPDIISYSAEIQPMIEQTCSTSGCHDATAAGGYNLLTHSSVSANGAQVLAAVKHSSGFTAMPLGGPQWADTTIAKLQCWLDQGALDN